MSIFTNPASRAAGEARAYVEAVTALVGSRDPLEILRATPAAARSAVDGMSDAELSRPEAPEKWSVRQVLRHLADSELVWGWRLRLVLTEDRPRLTGYDQDAWARRFGIEADADAALEELALLRRGNLGLLEGLSPGDLARVGVHSERGEESVELMIRLYAGHDLVHLRQLERIRSAVSG